MSDSADRQQQAERASSEQTRDVLPQRIPGSSCNAHASQIAGLPPSRARAGGVRYLCHRSHGLRAVAPTPPLMRALDGRPVACRQGAAVQTVSVHSGRRGQDSACACQPDQPAALPPDSRLRPCGTRRAETRVSSGIESLQGHALPGGEPPSPIAQWAPGTGREGRGGVYRLRRVRPR